MQARHLVTHAREYMHVDNDAAKFLGPSGTRVLQEQVTAETEHVMYYLWLRATALHLFDVSRAVL